MPQVQEKWKPIVGYPKYAVSNYGRVKVTARTTVSHPGRILKPTPDKYGYEYVSLYCEGKHKRGKIHQLVAEHFVGARPDGLTVNHIDGNKRNNRSSNLEYISNADNMRHAWQMGLCPVGEKHKRSKLKEWQVRGIIVLKGSMYVRDTAKLFGCASGLVCDIQNGKWWKHVEGCGCAG